MSSPASDSPGERGAPAGPAPEKTSGAPESARQSTGGEGEGTAPQEREERTGGGRRRFWATRRTPAIIVALLLLAAVGALLYDVASVRADRPAAAWRRSLADELATRPLDDPWAVGIAVAAVLLGVWLLILALTPGQRGLLPMRVEHQAVRPGIESGAVAQVLRDRALGVSGVRSVRVAVGRRRIRALAQAHFRDVDTVRTDLDTVLAQGVRELGLARRPALTVRVRRPAKQ